MATANGTVQVEFVLMTKEALQLLIREEVQKLVEPGAQRPSYLPPALPPAQYGQREWWQAPTITCGTSCAAQDANQIVLNADQDRPRWAEDVLDGPGSSTR